MIIDQVEHLVETLQTSIVVRYSPDADPTTGSTESYKLLEISPELMVEIDRADAAGHDVNLTIKGKPTDDAVICTPTSTFQLRTISLSNSLLVLEQPQAQPIASSSSAASSTNAELHLKDTIHEILELIPIVPRLNRIEKILREGAWSGMNPEASSSSLGLREEMVGQDEMGQGRRKRRMESEGGGSNKKRYTKAQLRSVVQASDEELDHGLVENNVIEIDGRLVYLPLTRLLPLLSILLSLITIHTPLSPPSSVLLNPSESANPQFHPIVDSVPIEKALQEEHGVDQEIFHGIKTLFGRTDANYWVVDITRMVVEMGKGMLLEENKDEPNTIADFLGRWKMEVGDDFNSTVNLDSLKGYYLVENSRLTSLSTTPDPSTSLLIPFPHTSLPSDPATRFSELFLTRPKWRPDDMEPFLRTLVKAGDNKVRDKMVAKFVRIVKERDGVWWYPRRTT